MGKDHLADEEIDTDFDRTRVRYRPLGPVLAVMPWNFPFWQVFRFAAPALLAGNTALLKHAPNVPQCALAIEGIFNRAGFGEGVFQNLFLETDRVSDVLEDPRVRAATVTGSVPAGRADRETVRPEAHRPSRGSRPSRARVSGRATAKPTAACRRSMGSSWTTAAGTPYPRRASFSDVTR